MDVTDEMINKFIVADITKKCDNCSSCFLNESDHQIITKLNLGSSEIRIWNALAFIYGISWTSFQKYNAEKQNRQLKSQDDLTFCSYCASLLNENYKSHINFEHSIESSSIVGLLKEFHNHQNSSTEQRVELLPHEEIETDINVDPFVSFVFENAEEDPIELEDPEEMKYETLSPLSESISSAKCEEVQSSSRRTSLESKRKLVIKAEKLTQEQILHFTSGENGAEKMRATPKMTSTASVKNTGNHHKTENKTEFPTLENILKGAKKLQKQRNFKAVARKQFTPKIKHPKVARSRQLPGSYECQLCSGSYSNLSNLIRHKRDVHNDETYGQPALCQFCNKKIYLTSKLKRHESFCARKAYVHE